MKFLTKTAEETIEIGEKIGRKLLGGELLLLEGDLGGGKTQFTKGLARGLGIEEIIISPTFTIERIYKAKENLELHHFDFYRLQGQDQELIEEVDELTKDPKNVVVIEWPKNLNFSLPDGYLELNFEYKNDSERDINAFTKGKYYEELLENL